MPRPLVLATRSAGKIRELRALCLAQGYVTQTLDEAGIAQTAAEDAIEVFETFVENAEAKARYFAQQLPGRVILAEDSGLEVDALHGAPGVRSKRWAGSTASGAQLDADNNAALLRALQNVRDAALRTARYRCVAVCVCDTEQEAAEATRVRAPVDIRADLWTGEGCVDGVLTRVARGAGGFGYDPYFESVELGKTFGEALGEEKARVSHRARALSAVFAAAAVTLRTRVQRVS